MPHGDKARHAKARYDPRVFGWFDTARLERLQDTGLLVLRVGAGGFMIGGHGWSKLQSFTTRTDFSDPLGIGSLPSLVLTVFAEVLCALLLIPGLFTRLAALPLVITMMVAGLVVHASDPFAKKEKAFLYAVLYLAIALAGPGRFSVDYVFRKAR